MTRAGFKWAQLRFLRGMIDELPEHYGDTEFDALKGALALAIELVCLDFDDDGEGFRALMDEGLGDYCCDGICNEIWDEKPKALRGPDLA